MWYTIEETRLNNIMNSYWYREYRTLAGNWALEVRRGVVPIGNIRKNESTGKYEFFEGRDTVVVPLYDGVDLNTLRQRIKARQP
jgi:hypothetical protein